MLKISYYIMLLLLILVTQIFPFYFYLSRLFPAKFKEHLSHDVLLMCVVCHQMASVHNSRLKQEIENEYSVPVNSSQKFKDDPRLLKVKNHAR